MGEWDEILGKTLWLRVRARIYNEKVRKRISFSNCQNKWRRHFNVALHVMPFKLFFWIYWTAISFECNTHLTQTTWPLIFIWDTLNPFYSSLHKMCINANHWATYRGYDDNRFLPKYSLTSNGTLTDLLSIIICRPWQHK